MAELPPDLALEAAKRLEYQYLDADESERFVGLLLPHLFDEEDEIDFEELRGTLGSAEIWDVLQEMREHESVAGERSLLGALHRQLRAEHLPALAEWLRWRLGEEPWLTTVPLGREDWRMGAPERHRALVWSDLADGYVPSLR